MLINDAARYNEYGPIAVEDDAAAIYSHVKDIYGGGTGVPGQSSFLPRPTNTNRHAA